MLSAQCSAPFSETAGVDPRSRQGEGFLQVPLSRHLRRVVSASVTSHAECERRSLGVVMSPCLPLGERRPDCLHYGHHTPAGIILGIRVIITATLDGI